MNNPKLLAVFTVILWSFAALVARQISLKSQFILLSFSFTFSLLATLVYSYYLDKNFLSKILTKFNYKYLFIGLFGYFIYWVGYVESFRSYGSASEPAVLNYTWPIFTVLFTESLFRNKSNKSKGLYIIEFIGVILGFLGVVFLMTEGNILSFKVHNLQGLLFGLLAGSSYGIFSAYSSKVKINEQGNFLLLSIFSSLVAMTLLSLTQIHLISGLNLQDILWAFVLGAIVDGIGYIAWTRANSLAREKNISISSVASIIFFLPVLSVIIITVVLKEKSLFQPYFLITLAFLLISSILCQKSQTIINIFSLGKGKK